MPSHSQVHVPEGLSVLELDTIKLAAQFVARNGKSFLTGLSSREHTSPAFAFLRPTHSLFTFFTSLCDAYSRCLMPPKGTKDKLAVDSKDGCVFCLVACVVLWGDEIEGDNICVIEAPSHNLLSSFTGLCFDTHSRYLMPPKGHLKETSWQSTARAGACCI